MATPRNWKRVVPDVHAGSWRGIRSGWPAGPCVYLAQRVDLFKRESRVLKIGSTNNLSRRLREFGEPYEALAVIDCETVALARAIEREIHAAMRRPRAGPGREFYAA